MSEEQLRDQTHDRWRETLALLGLPPEPAGSEPSSPQAETARQSPEMEALSHPEPEPEPAPQIEEREVLPSEPEFEEVFSEQIVEEFSAAPALDDEPAIPEAREPEREGPSRGRRRGRRGGRSRSPRGAEDSSGSETPANAEGEADSSEERSRDRGHGRKAQRSEPEPEYVTDDDEIEASAEEARDDVEGEEPDTLSDWNVPSWQELISSLYRPDR